MEIKGFSRFYWLYLVAGAFVAAGFLKSVIAPLLSRDVRATGFGLLETGFGVAWFLGSWVMGVLYEKSILILVIFSVILQLLSLLAFMFAKRGD